jgi:hypothetical protein
LFYYTPRKQSLGGYIGITLSVRLSIRSHFRNRYLSFYWKKWFYIWYMALAWWLVLCLPFPGLPHIYFLFTVRLANERVGVFLARRSVQHLVGFYTHWTYMHIFRHIFLSNYWWQKSDIWSQDSYRYAILCEVFFDPSDSYFLFADLVGFYTHWTYMHFFVTFFLATIDGRNLIFGHKLHIGTPYRGKCFWTHQIPTSCLPILLIFVHI